MATMRGRIYYVSRILGRSALIATIPLALLQPVALAGDFLTAKKGIGAPLGFSDSCRIYPWACARRAGAMPRASEWLAKARKVNDAVNATIRQVTDVEQYGKREHWTLPVSGKGDCEDIALVKKKKLVELGISPQYLLLATALGQGHKLHAVLVLRTTTGDYILDNLRSGVRRWSATGYTIMTMQSPIDPSRWDAIFAGPRIGVGQEQARPAAF